MKKIITLILLTISIMAFAQENNEIKTIKKDLETLQQQNKALQNSIFELQQGKNTTDRIQNEAQLIKKNIILNQDRENRFLSRIELMLLILSLLIAFFSFIGFATIKKMLTSLIVEKVNTLKEENIETISRLFKEEKWRMNLMKKSNIIVVNPTKKGDDENLNAVLQYFLTEKINTNFASEDIKNEINNKIDDTKLNIVLLEDSDKDWNKKDNFKSEAIDLVSKIPSNCFIIYFGGYGFPNDENDYSNFDKPNDIINRISFVNAPSKLYSNIIDTLKYMDIINPKINA